MPIRIVIAGSRRFEDYGLFCAVVDRYLAGLQGEEIILLSGHCAGTDTMAERYAKERGYALEVYPANWSLGRRAGPIRNKAMVDAADLALAFFDGGRGTQSLITLAQKKGIPLEVYPMETK